MGVARIFVFTIVFGLAAIFLNVYFGARVDIPEHMLNHPAVFLETLLTKEQSLNLLQLAKDMKDFPTNSNDLQFYKTKHEHIGEAQPIGPNGCDHAYLVPSVNKTECVLAGRVDIGRHFILSGGVQGRKEPYEDQVSRLLSFGRYMFDYTEYPLVAELFHSEVFQTAAKSVCPKGKQYLDPFQFNFIGQLPGQTVALHVDGVYFWGATRFQFPQWLLAVMQFSGLFQKEFVDQIQVVAYFHQWNATEQIGGEFVYWDTNQNYPKKQLPLSRAGSIVDGSKVIHAATVYKPQQKAPKIDKSAQNVLSYVGEDRWTLTSNGKLIENYETDDIRWTIVYRARCFASKEEANHFNNLPDNEVMVLDEILNKLANDLIARGKLEKSFKLEEADKLDFAIKLLDEYVKYPLSPYAAIPYNYCALGKLQPWLNPLLSLVCK